MVRLPVYGDVVALRELTGADERFVEGPDTRSAVALLARLTTDCDPRELAAADRDRLLASVYTSLFGDLVESTVHCRACTHPFDVSFALSGLTAVLDRESGHREPQRNGTAWRTERGTLFRLPTAAAEMDADSPESLLAACIVERAQNDTDEEIEAAMEAAAPLLDLDLDAQCPECGTEQKICFNIQSFLLERLAENRRRLFAEVHILAATYGWSLSEILSLRPAERSLLIETLENERRSATRAWA